MSRIIVRYRRVNFALKPDRHENTSIQVLEVSDFESKKMHIKI